VDVAAAPKPVGAYPHARKHGEFLFLSGIGSRTPGTNAIPGGPIYDENRQPLAYDCAAQTRQVVENIKTILAGCGASLDDIIDVQAFLVNMERDYSAFESVYSEYFSALPQRPALTTVSLRNLPTPIAVEFKVIARAPRTVSEDSGAASGCVDVEFAPATAGPCPHARKHGDLFFLSGIDSRVPGTNIIPGGPIYDENRQPLEYDIVKQTHQACTNIKTVLYGGCDSCIEDVLDVQVFLVDMERDFAAFNKVYSQYFGECRPTRTTVSLRAHPHPVAVQFKVIASANSLGGESCPACKTS
jgi:2-aminomuconate deaminase